MVALGALGLSTTTASKRLQDLESTLEVRLVDRNTRQLALTEGGELLLARSADMLDELQSAFAEAREPKKHSERYVAHRGPPLVRIDAGRNDRGRRNHLALFPPRFSGHPCYL
jgi:DNA-binding transcriptional LysR family regulator